VALGRRPVRRQERQLARPCRQQRLRRQRPQSNSDTSDASASNTNSTKQTADQDQSSPSRECGCGGGVGIQVLGQQAENGRYANPLVYALAALVALLALIIAAQAWRQARRGGAAQWWTSPEAADSTNSNTVSQDGDQSQSGGSGIEIQALGQEAENGSCNGALGHVPFNPSNGTADQGPSPATAARRPVERCHRPRQRIP
jgi:hypothetical protein